MRRKLAPALFLCFAATTGFAQSPLNGKWATVRSAQPMAATDAQRRQSVQLEVTIEDAKASGSFTIGGLGGRFYTFKDGKLSGNKVQFRTSETAQPTPVTTWTLELLDENTVTLSRLSLEIVGSNVLDLIAIMGAVRPTPAVQVAADTNPVIPTARQEPSIIGTIQDRSRARIPGVRVMVKNMDTGLESTTATDEAGVYRFPGVASGPYTITASLPGFDTATASNLNIGNTQSRQDLTLDVRGAPASANSQGGPCSTPGIVWCTVLHRAK